MVKIKLLIPILFFSFMISCSQKDDIQEIIEGVQPEEQEVQTEYRPGNANDLEKDALLKIDNATASEHQNGTPILNSIDGNKDSNYHSRWGNNTVFPVTLIFNFEEGEPTLDYMVMYPRNDGNNNGFIQTANIYYQKWGEDEFSLMGEYVFKENSTPKIVYFTDGIENPKSVKIVVTEGINNFVSLAEIEFYSKNTSVEENLSIFQDKAATTLKAGVTREEIELIENNFIKNMALAIYDGIYDEFRIGTFKSYPDPSIVSMKNKTNPYGLYDNVTGIYVPFGTEMVIFIDDFAGEISFRVVNHNQGFGGKDYILQPGMNRFNVQTEGLGYIIFLDDNEKIVKTNIATGKINGYFDIQKHTNADFSDLLDNAIYPFFDVLGEYSHLTFTKSAFQQNTQDIEKLIGLYDDLVDLEQNFIGLYKYDRENKTRMYFRANTHQNMYMFATAYRTEYSEGTLHTLANSESLKTSPWGPAHEVGHMNQTRPGLSWLGMTEVTTNIYSLYVQKAWDNASRIDSETLNGWSNRYEKAFTEIISDELAHNAHNDVFCKLVPFWQLQLYLADVKGQVDFYKDVHEAIREAADQPTPGASQIEFVKITSDIAQIDLTDFFESWGFLTPVNIEIDDYGNGQFTVTQNMVDQAKSYIASKSYPKPNAAFQYITDSNVKVYETQLEVVPGTAVVSGQSITVHESHNAAVYQQERNGKIIFISPRSSFKVDSFMSEDKLYAVGFDGNRTELIIN